MQSDVLKMQISFYYLILGVSVFLIAFFIIYKKIKKDNRKKISNKNSETHHDVHNKDKNNNKKKLNEFYDSKLNSLSKFNEILNLFSISDYDNFLNDTYIQNRIETIKDNIAKFKENLDKLKDDRLKITLIGEYSSGKSSFINAFIFEKNILQESINETTTTIYEITYGKHVELEYRFFNSQKIESKKFSSIENLKKEISEINRFKSETETLEKAIIKLPNPILKNNNIAIFDTPGIGSNNQEKFEPIIKKIINESDLVLLILDTSKGLISQVIKKTIKNWIENFNPFNFYLIFNKIDMVAEEDGYLEKINEIKDENSLIIFDFFQQRNVDKINKLEMFEISSKYAINRKNKKNEKYIDKFKIFKTDLIESFSLKLNQIIDDRKSRIENIEQYINQNIIEIKTYISNIYSNELNDLRSIKKEIDKVEKEIIPIISKYILSIDIFLKELSKQTYFSFIEPKYKLFLDNTGNILYGNLSNKINNMGWFQFFNSQSEIESDIKNGLLNSFNDIFIQFSGFINEFFHFIINLLEKYQNITENINNNLYNFGLKKLNYQIVEKNTINQEINELNNSFQNILSKVDIGSPNMYFATSNKKKRNFK